MDDDLDPVDEPGDESSEEKVGFGNPPKHSQWPRGFCPNPAGRPRKARGRRAILERIANELVDLKIGSKVIRMNRAEAVAMAVRNAMANGNPAAQKLNDKLLNQVREEGPPTQKGVLITGMRLSEDEWTAEFGHLGGGPIPPPKPIQISNCMEWLK